MTDRQITFRRATIADLDALVATRMQFVTEVSSVPIPAGLDAAIRGYFARTISSGECVTYLAEVEGKDAGAGSVVFYDLPPNAKHPTGRHAYLLNMYTEPAYRRRGIAGEILRRLLEEARAAGAPGVALHMLPDGRHLYESAGFEAGTTEMTLLFNPPSSSPSH